MAPTPVLVNRRSFDDNQPHSPRLLEFRPLVAGFDSPGDNELYAIVHRPDCLKLVLNFSVVEFLSSAMLGKLLSAKKMLAQKGGVLRLCEVCPTIRMIFKLTHLDHILDIRETEAEAVEV